MKKLIKTKYKRVLLKISGEILKGKDFITDINIMDFISKEIKKIISLNIQLSIVIGGGNIFRGKYFSKIGINRVSADKVGMISTIINGLILNDYLNNKNIKTHLMSAIPISGICKMYNYEEAIKIINNNEIVIFTGGIGNPFFTTDSASCLRAIETKSDLLIKGTNVDGIYEQYKNKENKNFFKYMSYKDVLKKKIKIMDLTAFCLAEEHKLPIIILNIQKPNILYNIIVGKSEGTLIK